MWCDFRWIKRCSLLLCLLVFMSQGHSETVEFTVIGTIVTEACNINMEDSELTVDMGTIKVDSSEIGQPFAEKGFNLSFECKNVEDEKITFKITFLQSGNHDSEFMDVQCAGNSDCGFKVGITDKSDNIIPLGEAFEYGSTILSGKENIFFKSKLFRTAATIQAGEFSAIGQVSVVYD